MFLCNFRVYQPVVLAQLIRMFSPAEERVDSSAIYISGGILSGLTFVYIFWHHHLNFELARIGMRVRVACSSLIYRKVKIERTKINFHKESVFTAVYFSC